MKKVVAILLVIMIMAGTVAFAADATSSSSGQKSMVRSFFGNAQKLFTQQIPDTPNQKSSTHTIWEQTGPGTPNSKSK